MRLLLLLIVSLEVVLLGSLGLLVLRIDYEVRHDGVQFGDGVVRIHDILLLWSGGLSGLSIEIESSCSLFIRDLVKREDICGLLRCLRWCCRRYWLHIKVEQIHDGLFGFLGPTLSLPLSLVRSHFLVIVFFVIFLLPSRFTALINVGGL